MKVKQNQKWSHSVTVKSVLRFAGLVVLVCAIVSSYPRQSTNSGTHAQGNSSALSPSPHPSTRVIPPSNLTWGGALVVWNKTWGGTINDEGRAVAVDGNGSTFLAGRTASFSPSESAFLAKYAPNGTQLWNRTASGPDVVEGWGVAVDASGNAYLAGDAFSTGHYHAFLGKYAPDGTSLWNRTWGGNVVDKGYGVSVDANGNAFLAGTTASFGAGLHDAFLAKYDPSGTQLWNQTWGGSGEDYGYGVSADAGGNAYIAGYTNSFGAGLDDAFLAKYDPSGNLLWNLTWGGSGEDYGQGVAADADGNAFLCGFTSSFGAGGSDAFIAKFAPDGTQLWNRTWGGPLEEEGYGVAADALGNAYLTGDTTSVGPDGGDFYTFLAKYAPDGTSMWNWTWGGAQATVGYGVAAGANGNVTLGGTTWSYGAGAEDAFLSKFTPININGIGTGNVFNATPPLFNATIADPALDTAWYAVGASGTNRTFTPGSLTLVNATDWGAQSDGPVAFWFWVNDSAGNFSASCVVVQKDTTAPVITNILPTDGTSMSAAPSLAFTIIELHLQDVWYTLGASPTQYFLSSTGGSVDASAWVALPLGVVTIHLHANDTVGNEGIVDISITKVPPPASTTPPADTSGIPQVLSVGVNVVNCTTGGATVLELNLTTTKPVQVTMTFNTTNPAPVAIPDAIGFFNISVNDTSAVTFPVTLKVFYNFTAVTNAGIAENDLVIAYFNPATNAWEQVGGIVNTTEHSLTVQLTHFSVYGIAKSQPQSVTDWHVLAVVLGVTAVCVLGIVAFVNYYRKSNDSRFQSLRIARISKFLGKFRRKSRSSGPAEEDKKPV